MIPVVAYCLFDARTFPEAVLGLIVIWTKLHRKWTPESFFSIMQMHLKILPKYWQFFSNGQCFSVCLVLSEIAAYVHVIPYIMPECWSGLAIYASDFKNLVYFVSSFGCWQVPLCSLPNGSPELTNDHNRLPLLMLTHLLQHWGDMSKGHQAWDWFHTQIMSL